MGFWVMFPCMYTLYNTQIRVNTFISLNIYHFFRVKTLKILASSCLKRKMHNKSSLPTVALLSDKIKT